MTTATKDMLTADDASRMTGVPDSTLHDWAAKRDRGSDSPHPHHCGRHPDINDGLLPMLWNGSPRQGFAR
jgi:hypothetical protein